MRSVITKVKQAIQKDKSTQVIRWCDEWQRRGLAPKGDYLEFGTFKGASAIAFYRALEKFYKGKIPKDSFHMYLFDSFEGLPEVSHEADRHQNWRKGTFDVGGKESFRKILLAAGVPEDRFTLVAGYYEDSLPKFDWKKIKFASYVNMDCDLYTSTVTAMEAIRPVIGNRTLFYFDDLHSFAGNPHKGQIRAIREFNEKSHELGINPCPILQNVAESRIYWAWKND